MFSGYFRSFITLRTARNVLYGKHTSYSSCNSLFYISFLFLSNQTLKNVLYFSTIIIHSISLFLISIHPIYHLNNVFSWFFHGYHRLELMSKVFDNLLLYCTKSSDIKLQMLFNICRIIPILHNVWHHYLALWTITLKNTPSRMYRE